MHSSASAPVKRITSLFLFLFCFSLVSGQNYPPEIPTASSVAIYKEVDGYELKAWIFNPPKHQAGAKKPAIVFFFGGGWVGGTPTQFVRHCEYLSARGMVAITVDYRVQKRQGVNSYKCVSDAKSAIRWIRANADSLGVDPNKIVGAGGSAGGHLAVSTALLPTFDEGSDDLDISCVPNALALFNPVLVLGKVNGKFELPTDRRSTLESRLGTSLESMSPFHYLKPEMPPSIVFHGTADKTVPYFTAELFQQSAMTMGNDCRLVTYPGEGHGFFNFGRKQNGAFVSTVQHLDKFLVELGYLVDLPQVHEKIRTTAMSFNIRYDTRNDKENWWGNRKEELVRLLQFYSPDFLGIQEGLHHQVKFIDQGLMSHTYIGVGRDDGKGKGEYAAIFYDSTKFNLVQSNNFWLSDTPDTVSVGWDASMERICTYGIFQHKKSGSSYYVFNAHFDHIGKEARIRSARLILDKIKELKPRQDRIILMGDFNSQPDNAPILILKEHLEDGQTIAQKGFYGPEGTWSGFDPQLIPKRRIDYIFTKNIKVVRYRHVDDRRSNNLCVSDHLPVMIEMAH